MVHSSFDPRDPAVAPPQTRVVAENDDGDVAAAHGRERPLEWHRRQQLWIAAVTLLLLDAMFLAANIAHRASNDPDEPRGFFTGGRWSVGDGSHIEIFGHVQLVAAAVMLAFLAFSRRSLLYGAWTLAVVVLVLDDFAMIHERMASRAIRWFDLEPMWGLKAHDLGELAIWVIMSAALGALIIIALSRASSFDRRNSLVLFACVAVLAFFAVGVDQLSVILRPHVSETMHTAVTFTEAAGELLGMTLILLAAHRMTLYQKDPAR